MIAQIIEKTKSLEISEERKSDEHHLELVVFNRDLQKWYSAFDEVFEEPLKAAGEPPSDLAKKVAAKFGGIMDNQALYLSREKQSFTIGMFWPWSDDEHVTIKLNTVLLPS